MKKILERMFGKEYVVELRNKNGVDKYVCWTKKFNVFDAVEHSKGFVGSKDYSVETIKRL